MLEICRSTKASQAGVLGAMTLPITQAEVAKALGPQYHLSSFNIQLTNRHLMH